MTRSGAPTTIPALPAVVEPVERAGAIHHEGVKAAADLAKQIITLATGAVAFTVTFLEKFVVKIEGAVATVPFSLYVAWALFGLAIVGAMWTLMSITGTMQSYDRKLNGWELTPAQSKSAAGDNGNLTMPPLIMLLFFLAAVVGMIVTGISV